MVTCHAHRTTEISDLANADLKRKQRLRVAGEAWKISLLCIVAWVLIPPQQARAQETPSQASIAARLRHQKALVRSMECAYEFVAHPTDAANAALLRKKYSSKSKEELMALTCTPEIARRRCLSAKWWRHGEKERWDETYAEGGRTKSKAFDGNVVREISRSVTQANAALSKLNTSHLLDTVRCQPFSLVFELLGEPFHEIIRKGHDFQVEPGKAKGESSLRVFVRHPSKHYGLVCVIDSQGRIAEWLFLDKRSTFDRPILRQTCSLLDYQGYTDASGETIWFPRKAQLGYYDPATKEGPPVQWGVESITFRDVKFNINITDSQFVLDLPPDAEIYDDVTGQGFLPAGTALPAWTNPPRLDRSWTWLWVVGGAAAALVVLSLAWILFCRWRTSQARG